MELRDFVDEELYPAIWENLSSLFPEMSFTQYQGKWRSPKNLDGSTPSTPRRDKTIVTPKLFHVALENGGGDASGRAKDLITLFMEHNGLGDRIEAIKEIARLCSLTLPEGADAKKYEEARERREQLALSYNRQKEALFSSEGAHVLRYLKEKRGYSEELIREMGLGYLSPAEAQILNERCKVGIAWKAENYPLSIAYFSRGNVMGFKFRYITPIEGKAKYMNTKSLGTEGMDSNPFGLTPQSLNRTENRGEVVVVEGELDALHAIALGLTNVIAVAGGKITEGKASALKKNGYKNVVILLDADEAGQRFTAESIQVIDHIGLNAYVATLPEGKDVDEYLKNHSIEDLREVVSKAVFGGVFLYQKEKEKFLRRPQTEKEFLIFLEEYTTIASRYKDPLKREILFTYLQNDFDVNVEAIQKGIREKIELQVATEEKKRKREAATESLKRAVSLLSNGETRKATETASTALDNLREADRGEEFSFLLEDNTDELWEKYRESQKGLSSKFIFFHKEGEELEGEEFYFPTGAISVIGAPTGHGKTQIMESIALDALSSLEEGETILYITFEENEMNINKKFLNAYANILITQKGLKGNNMKSISEYLHEGKTTFFRANTIEAFKAKEEEWKEIRRKRKIKIIKPEDNYLENLLGIIDFSVKNLKIKAIFIDYIQEIYVRDWSKYSRTDELKEAMVRLDLKAQETKIPFIIAAQLSREATSPVDLQSQYIADSGWIERKASEIILVWSNHKRSQNKDVERTNNRIETEIEQELGEKLNLGERGKLYLKLTKSRTFTTGSHTIVPIDANTGRVGEKRKPQQGELFIIQTPSVGKKPTKKEELSTEDKNRAGGQLPDDDLPF